VARARAPPWSISARAPAYNLAAPVRRACPAAPPLSWRTRPARPGVRPVWLPGDPPKSPPSRRPGASHPAGRIRPHGSLPRTRPPVRLSVSAWIVAGRRRPPRKRHRRRAASLTKSPRAILAISCVPPIRISNSAARSPAHRLRDLLPRGDECADRQSPAPPPARVDADACLIARAQVAAWPGFQDTAGCHRHRPVLDEAQIAHRGAPPRA